MLGCAVGLLLGAAAVSELDAYRLPEEPYFPDGLEPTATQDYGFVSGKHCASGSIHPYLHTLPAVSAASCAAKCGPTSACAGKITGDCVECNGYMPAYDTAESDSLCMAPTDCRALCTSMPDCYGYDAYSGSNHHRCVLKTYACLEPVLKGELKASPTVTFYFKDKAVSAECPLGKGVHLAFKRDTAQTVSELSDAEIDVHGVVGIYDEGLGGGSKVYTRVDGTDRIVQHASGCGWVVEKEACTGVGAPGSLCPVSRRLSSSRSGTCEDNAAAVAAIFGAHAGDAGVCGAKEWSRAPGGYCAFPLFAALCPGSCGRAACDADAEDAAADLLALLRAEGTGCAAATKFCSHPVVNAVCRATCAAQASQTKSRRGARAVPADFAFAFRAQLARRPEPRAVSRRLGWDLDVDANGTHNATFYEVYSTWNPPVAPEASQSCGYDADGSLTTSMDKTTTLYDLFKLHESLEGQTWEYDCVGVDTYLTLAEVYCPLNNLGTRGTVGLGGSGLEPVCSSTRTPDGAISGHNVEQLTGVTPSDCEKACCDKSWCKSFDYHKNSNKCDLSDKTASDVGGLKTDYGGNPYDHYEIVHSPPSGIVLPKVEAQMCVAKCGPSGPKAGVDPAKAHCDGWDASLTPDSNAVCLPRSMCEALCDSVEECGSFDMHKSLNRCYLNQRYCDPGRNPYSYPKSTLFDLEVGIYTKSKDYDFVYKSKSPTVYKTSEDLGCAGFTNLTDYSGIDESCAVQCAGPSVGTTASTLLDALALETDAQDRLVVPSYVTGGGSDEAITALPEGYMVKVDYAGFLVGGRVVDQGSPGGAHSLTNVLFGTPTLVINYTDVNDYYSQTLDVSSAVLAPNYEGKAEEGETYAWVYAVRMPAGISPVPSMADGGLLLKTGFVASTILSVIVEETIVVPLSYPVSDPIDICVSGNKTMILAFDATGVDAAANKYLAEVVVVVVSDCSESGCESDGVTTLKLGKAYGPSPGTTNQIAMTPASTGAAVLVWASDALPTPTLYFVSASGISRTVKLDMLDFGPVVEPYGKYFGSGAMSTVKGKTTVVSKLPASLALEDQLVSCTPDGCGVPRSLNGSWQEGGRLESGPVLCLTAESCVVLMTEVSSTSGTSSAKLALVQMDSPAETEPKLLMGTAFSSSAYAFTASKPVALSDAHVFFSQPRSSDKTSFYWPLSAASRTGYGFAIWEKAFTWTGLLLQPAWEALYGGTVCPPLSGDEICGGRPACESVCDRVEDCVGFTLDENETCRIYDACVADEMLEGEFTSAVKDKVVPCTVTVEGAKLPKGVDASHLDSAKLPTLLNTEYVQQATNVFVSATNESAIFYDSGHSCLGYVLGLNKHEPYTIYAVTFPDADGQVQTDFQGWFRTAKSVPAIQSLVMCDALTGPPVEGQSPLYSCADALVKKICFRSCTPLTEGTVADTAASYHKLVSTAETPTATVDNLHADDDAMLSAYVGSAVTCAASKSPTFCGDKIKKYLCPVACESMPSAVYSLETFSCLDVVYDDIVANFTPVFRTFANGSDIAYKMPQAIDEEEYGTIGDMYRVAAYGYPQCSTAALGFQELLSGDLLSTAEVFPAKAGVAEHLELRPECAKESLCPTLTSCVESFYVFERELEHMLAGATLTKDGTLFPAHFTGLDKPFTTIGNPCRFTVPFVQCPARMAALHSANWVDFVTSPFGLPAPDFTTESDSFNYAFPKYILTAQRATGFIRTALYDFGKELFRPVPGATRLRFKQFAPAAETVVVSLSGSETWWSTFNYDKVYDLPTGYSSWASDVIRLEAFDYVNKVSSSLKTKENITFEITAHGYSEIEVFRFAFDGTKPTKVPGVTVSPNAENLGWFSVTIPGNLANADFIAAADLDECALPADELAFPCEAPADGGLCVNKLGSYHCECISGYKGQDGTLPGKPLADGVQCVVDQYVASPTAFLLYHEEDAEYGVEISELKLYDGSTVKSDGTAVCMGTCKDGSMSEDCAFGYKSDESASSYAQNVGPWTFAKSISSSSSFPGFGPAKVFDNDKDTNFKSERLTLSRAAGTGAWIYWEVDAETNVECVEVVVYCTSEQPKKFVLHRGKVGEVQQSPAFGSRGVPFTDPGKPGFMSFVAKTFAPGEVKLDLAVPCGIKNAQYFGEKLLDYPGVLTVCACEQLCLDHVDEGCATYKWYSETSHCFLQADIFEGTDPDSQVLPDGALSTPRAALRNYYVEGRGWWKRPLSYGWPGWFTGSIGPIPLSFSTTPKTVTLDTSFSLTVVGTDLPFDDEIKEDSGSRQRIKIVPSSAICGIALPPPEVTGVDCTNEYTCTPRPEKYTRTSATWSGVQLTASKAETTYKVCYCGGECWAVENWKEVPGALEVDRSAFSFEVVGDAPAATDTALSLMVSRPAFSGTSDKDTWKLKLVDSRFDCAALGGTAFCGGAADCGTPASSYGPDEVLFSLSADGTAAAGDYLVCVAEGAGSFGPVPHATGRYLKLSGSGASHPAGFFREQQFSAKAGTSVTLSVAGYALDGSVEELSIGSDCPATGSVVVAKSSSTDSKTVFAGDIPTEWDGEYKLCEGNETVIGTVSVTTRPYVGVDYVVTPGESTSFEITGDALDYMTDRVMVVDCVGTCGVSGPAKGVKQPGVAVSPYMDRPAMAEPDAFAEMALHVGDWSTTKKSMGMYCPGNLLPIEMGTLADKHRCYPKCYANTCSGDNCFCSGYEGGYDTAESSSICLDVEQCTDLCAQTPGCTSVDMHTTKNRCFLNTGECTTLHPDKDYNVWYKVMDMNTRRTMDRGRSLSAAQVRELIAGEDPGVSWNQMLRFDAVEFTTGGEFKLCFCDRTLLASGAICNQATDYKIEVGKVHATGLECLLTNPKMQRGTCVPQTYGGLRCYDGAAPEVEIPSGYVAIPDTTRSKLSQRAQLLLSFCQFAPEEEAMQFGYCAQHREFAAPVSGAAKPVPGA